MERRPQPGDEHFGAPAISAVPESDLPSFNLTKEEWWRSRRRQDEPWQGYLPERERPDADEELRPRDEASPHPASRGPYASCAAFLARIRARLLEVTVPVSWSEERERVTAEAGGEAEPELPALRATGEPGLARALLRRLVGDAGGWRGEREPVGSLLRRAERLDREGLCAIAELDVRRHEVTEDDAFWLVQRVYQAVVSDIEGGEVLRAYKLVEGIERPCHELRSRGFAGPLDAVHVRMEAARARLANRVTRPPTRTTAAVRRLVATASTVEALAGSLDDLPASQPLVSPTTTSRDFHLNELALRDGFPELYGMLPERSRRLVDIRLRRRELNIGRERAIERSLRRA